MNNQTIENEIDLRLVAKTIWDNKWQVILITLVSVMTMFIYQINKKPSIAIKSKFEAVTSISPISIFDEFEYSAYNSFIDNITKKKERVLSVNGNNSEIFRITEKYKSIQKINAKYLMSLFTDKLYEKSILGSLLIKYNLIKKENYTDEQEYKKEIQKKIDLFQIILTENISYKKGSILIKFITYNPKIWNELLIDLEKTMNEEIRIYILDSFNEAINNELRLMQYEIEDIRSNESLDKEKKLKLISRINSNKDINRIQNLFSATPVLNPEKFVAAKFNVTVLKNDVKKKSPAPTMITLLVLAAIIGLILSLLYVFFGNSIKKN
jgi:hypothetical protein